MEARQLFAAALEQATAVVDTVTTKDLTNPTPNTAWNVRALATHMLYELHWAPEILAGKTIEEVGKKYDNRIVADSAALQTSWHTAVEAATKASEAADLRATVYVSYGHITAEDYLREMGCDVLIHAWDLGEGIGMPVVFEKALVSAAYDHLLPKKDELHRTGLYAQPVPVPADVDIQTKLLAITGRSKHWRSAVRP